MLHVSLILTVLKTGTMKSPKGDGKYSKRDPASTKRNLGTNYDKQKAIAYHFQRRYLFIHHQLGSRSSKIVKLPPQAFPPHPFQLQSSLPVLGLIVSQRYLWVMKTWAGRIGNQAIQSQGGGGGGGVGQASCNVRMKIRSYATKIRS